MSMGLKANADGSGAVQIGGSDAITITSGLAVTIPQTLAVTGAQTVGGNLTLTGNASGIIKRATAVTASSVTSINFTGIPSTARRVTVTINQLTTSGTSIILIRLASGGTIATTGYSAGAGQQTGTNSTGVLTSGFPFTTSGSASSIYSGQMILTNHNGNNWTASGCSVSAVSGAIGFSGGVGTGLAGVLDQIRITTVNGTDTLDTGSINILWE